MNGLALSRLYYDTVFIPECRRALPEAMGHFAAGLVGEGSECFGFDDELSRDHSFGLRLQLWLTDGDYDRFGRDLTELYNFLPDECMGFHRPKENPNEGKRNGVFRISEFYRGITGLPGVPETESVWLSVAEPHFAAAVNGRVFSDEPGEFSRIRSRLLAHYPEDVTRYFLAQHAAMAAQTGQYNMLRAHRHGEELAVYNIKASFIRSVIAMVFLLNKVYRPFYKWAPRAMRGLPLMGAVVYDKLLALSETTEISRECSLVEEICAMLIDELNMQGISMGRSDFLMDHLPEIMGRIKSDAIRARGISMVF